MHNASGLNTSSSLLNILLEEEKLAEKLDILSGGLCFCGIFLLLAFLLFYRLKKTYGTISSAFGETRRSDRPIKGATHEMEVNVLRTTTGEH